MKILRVISSMNPENGGPAQGIRNSIPAQENIGVQNEVVCFDAPDAPFLNSESLIIHALGPAKGPYQYCPKFKSWFEQNVSSFDVVIIHGIWLYNSYGAYRIWHLVKRGGGKIPKLYVMPHGMLDPYFQRAKSRKIKAIRNWIFWKLIENKVINGADGLLFTCEQELNLARKNFKPYYPRNEMNVGYGIQLPPGPEDIDKAHFVRKCPDIDGKPYWLFLSRIHPKKGIDILLNAYLKLKEEYQEIPDLVIAGPGLETFFGRSLQKKSTGRSVHFPGMLQGEAKWGAFYGCKAFVLPSHQENFGIAVVEALACARPVLISNQVNIWREVEQGNGGLICDDTESGVYAMLENWLSQPEDRKATMAKNALSIFNNNYKIEKAALKMVASFQ